jgi:hypothetical protein
MNAWAADDFLPAMAAADRQQRVAIGGWLRDLTITTDRA